jgi:hypothetical protein
LRLRSDFNSGSITKNKFASGSYPIKDNIKNKYQENDIEIDLTEINYDP